jgi:hypothetical protein
MQVGSRERRLGGARLLEMARKSAKKGKAHQPPSLTNKEEMMKHVISFKTYPYFWELSKSGVKPFDIRLYDPDDERFNILNKHWRDCTIELVNTETGEKFSRDIKRYQVLYPEYLIAHWVIIFF